MKCTKCKKEHDEKISHGLCPFCGNIDSIPKAEKKYNPKWLKSGTMIHERYEIIEPIAEGGFGITYKAFDHNNRIFRALKEYFQLGVTNRIPGTTEVLIAAPSFKEQFEYGKKRLLQEARIVAKFQSPNIVRVNDFFEENNTSYMVMEYLPYHDLQYYIENRMQFNIPTIVDIGVKLCDALHEIHASGVVHRDIAPDNIMLTDKNEIKIIDFGSARLSESDIEDRIIAFKPGYAPPEQYKAIDLKHDLHKEWTDVYAVGATLYALLTGEVPIESTDRKIEIDGKDGRSGIDPVCYPDQINHNIPENLNNTVMTAMAVNIHERFKNVDDLKKALRNEKVVEKIEIVRKKKRNKRRIGITAGFLVGAGLLSYGIAIYQNKKSQFQFLEEADITMWYSYDKDDQEDNKRQNMLEDIVAELTKSDKYSKVTINLVPIEKDKYENSLIDAKASGTLPTIMEYRDCIGDGELEDISAVTDSLKDCYLVDQFTAKTISTGVNIPVIYYNYIAFDNPEEEVDLKVSMISDLLDITSLDAIAMNKNVSDLYSEMFDDFYEYDGSIQGGLDDFLEGDALFYLSDTSDIETIMSYNAAQYGIVLPYTSSLKCAFTDAWCMKECSEAEEVAGKEILKYLLSNVSETYGYIEEGLNGIPIEKNSLKEFSENRSVFKNIDFDFGKYSILERGKM